jgi:hypothetical protein
VGKDTDRIEGPFQPDWKASNPKDQAATTRIDLSSFPPSAVAYGALAFVEGGLKYGEFNWRVAGVLASVYVAAARRHLDKWWNGEEEDPKTLVPHLANLIACAAILIDAIEQGKLVDDRPPKQSSSLYDRFEAKVAHLQKIFPRRAARFTAIDEDGRNPEGL